ncbi:kinase-like domain-containing protein, partial [Boletus edulis BED1]
QGNVLVEDDGTARLSDFGLCTVIGGVSGGSSMIRRTGCTGTIPFAAPELVLNCDTASPTKMSDIYSLGCIMLQILSGQPPWENEREAGIIVALHKGGHVPRPKHRPICDRDWAIIQRCCLPVNARPSIGEVLDYISVKRASPQESHTTSTGVCDRSCIPILA